MSVISYSGTDSQIYGFYQYPELTGENFFDLLEELVIDIDTVFALPTNVYYNVLGVFIPFVKTNADINLLPFVSRPEAVYKLGSFSWVKAYEKFILPDTTVRYDPISYASDYIIYPTQTLQESKFIVRFPNPNIDDYVIDYDATVPTPENVRTIDTRTIDSGYGVSSNIACGCYLNLPQGITSTLKIFYSARILGVGATATIGDYQPILI